MSTRPEVPADAYCSALFHQQFPIATHLSSLVLKPQALVCSAELSNAGQTCVSLVVQTDFKGKKSVLSWAKTQCVAPSTDHRGGLLHSVAQHMAMPDGCEQAHSAIQTPARGEAHRLIESEAEGLRQQTYLGSG